MRFKDRFVIGSDTWTGERWQRHDELLAGYRAWPAQLPPEVADAVAWCNAEAGFTP